ncbi:MAG: PAS domain-containing sensor histidine kinase [Gammaproteobacteria bacterium]|nr:PAS domain-containing sensor histidine kinase [Gammaproteobacteria bacterium]
MLRLERRNRELERMVAAATKVRDHYVDLYESAPIACLTLDAKGAIADVNLSACSLLGLERGKKDHRAFESHIPKEDVKYWRQLLKHAKQSGHQQGCELTLRRIDGTRFQASLEIRYAEVGSASAISIVLADISNQKRREKDTMDWRKEMAELRKMQIAAQTATAIAHELNQPLLAISNYSEAAVKFLGAESPDLHKVTKAVQGCQRQAHRAGETIHELLDYLSLKEIQVEAINLNEIIGQVVDAARSEHELQFDSVLLLEDGLPPVLANRIHVEKVIFNLLRNGIEAMHESEVPQPSITVTVYTKGDVNSAQVTIQDNGPGVKEENLQQLFKPFFTTKVKGIGMGLAVSRSLIEANGGQLWIDPSEGPGATFHLTLPFAS